MVAYRQAGGRNVNASFMDCVQIAVQQIRSISMRVEVKNNAKKGDGLGVGFLVAFAVLFSLAFYLGGPTFKDVFPVSVERALMKFRSEFEGTANGIQKLFSNAYETIAGR
jgi:hypothetical protein